MTYPRMDLPRDQIADFCRRWKITEFSLFGSVLRDDFRPDSDIDVLVSFSPEAHWSLIDLAAMETESQLDSTQRDPADGSSVLCRGIIPTSSTPHGLPD